MTQYQPVPGVTVPRPDQPSPPPGPRLQDGSGGASPVPVNPEDAPKEFTQQDIDKAKQDALSEAGRTDLKRQQVETDAAAVAQRVTDQDNREREWQDREDARKLEAARDNPEMLNVIQEERAVRERARVVEVGQRALDTDRALHADSLANSARVEIRQTAFETGIDPELLIDMSGGDPVQARKLAPVMPKANAGNGAGDGTPGPGSVPAAIRPDSSVTLGGEQPTLRSMIDRAKGKT